MTFAASLRLLAQFDTPPRWALQLARASWLDLFVALACGAALVAAISLAVHWLAARRRAARHSPRRLFRQLCAAHGLSYRQRKLLVELARRQHLSQPAVLFVEPALWEAAGAGRASRRRLAEIKALQEHVFARP